MAYRITAEIKKGWQEWGTVVLTEKSKMTKRELIKIYEVIKVGFNKDKVEVQVRNFRCERV